MRPRPRPRPCSRPSAQPALLPAASAQHNSARLRKAQDHSFGHALFTCARLLDALAHAEVNRRTGRVLARPALMRLVPYLDFTGIRPGELARLTDVSKQAVSQALAPLVEDGMVEYIDDPEDGRARKVRLTQKGGDAFALGLSVLAHFERALADRVGSKKIKALFDGLRAIQPVLEEWSAAGAG